MEPYWALKSTLWGPCSLSLMYKTSISRHKAAKGPFLCAPMPCIAISLHTLCSNNGIINFPMAKLAILGGHDFVLAPKIWAHVVQNCILDHTCVVHPSIHPSVRPPMHPCIRSPMHRHMYTTTYLTLCDGWRVGLVHAKCHCNHIRDNRYRDLLLVTLRYLTLPYLKLV